MPNWLPIPGFDPIYSASDEGQVRIDVPRHNTLAGQVLRQHFQRDGYLFVRLSLDGSQATATNRAVARLVLMAHCRAPLPGEQVNHRDGVKTDNRLENLEWLTGKENFRYSTRGWRRDYRGEKNPCARLTETDVLAIRERAANGASYFSLGRAFGVTSIAIRFAAIGKTWPHVGGPLAGPRAVGRPRGG